MNVQMLIISNAKNATIRYNRANKLSGIDNVSDAVKTAKRAMLLGEQTAKQAVELKLATIEQGNVLIVARNEALLVVDAEIEAEMNKETDDSGESVVEIIKTLKTGKK